MLISIVYHQPIAIQRSAISVQWAAIAYLGNAAIVEVVAAIALRAGGYAMVIHAQICRWALALRAALVIGKDDIITKVGLANNQSCQPKTEYSVLHLCIWSGIHLSFEVFYLVSVLGRGGPHRQEIP